MTIRYAPDSPMAHITENAERLARTPLNVIVTGETGTGKGEIARYIHRYSGRQSGPFVTMNCNRLGELADSTLFGYKKGAFTGAYADTPGKLEAANGGTLFLDEVADLPIAAQGKLHDFFDTGRYTRVGDVKERTSDARIISATNREIWKSREFREDLYSRLNGTRLHMPPLRERRMDIGPICNFYLEMLNKQAGTQKNLTPSARELLEHYEFPGNVRELRSILEYAFYMSEGERIDAFVINEKLDQNTPDIHVASSSPFQKNAGTECVGQNNAAGIKTYASGADRKPESNLFLCRVPYNWDDAKDEVCMQLLLDAARRTGSARKAAHLLGVDNKTLYYFIEKIGYRDMDDFFSRNNIQRKLTKRRVKIEKV